MRERIRKSFKVVNATPGIEAGSAEGLSAHDNAGKWSTWETRESEERTSIVHSRFEVGHPSTVPADSHHGGSDVRLLFEAANRTTES